MIPIMTRPGNPYDNASCESFMKTLKQEEIYANEYRDLEHLSSRALRHSSNTITIDCRLHWALGYRPPEECGRNSPFHATGNSTTKQGLAGRSFEGHNSASSNIIDQFLLILIFSKAIGAPTLPCKVFNWPSCSRDSGGLITAGCSGPMCWRTSTVVSRSMQIAAKFSAQLNFRGAQAR